MAAEPTTGVRRPTGAPLNVQPRYEIPREGITAIRLGPRPTADYTHAAHLTPLGYDDVNDYWTIWNPAGSNGEDVMRAILIAEDGPIELHATNEVWAQGAMKGLFHFNDLVRPVDSQGVFLATVNEFTTHLDGSAAAQDPTLRELGIDIDGLETVR